MKESPKTAQSPLILRAHRLMDAFAKSDDEKDFYLDRQEGFIVYADLYKSQAEIDALEDELQSHKSRYCLLPKLTFYETKKIMEGFINEKVYDIDTKEKLLDIVQSKEARDNFLDFIYDHLSELEKWQQYYQERSRIRIIEWLRNNNFNFVFEEDLELEKPIVEKLKQHLFDTKVPKDLVSARDIVIAKAKTYYSTEALNPRPKRGRPPKQTIKIEIEPQMTTDIYLTVPPHVRPFLYIPDITSTSGITFSSKYDSEEEFLASRNPSKQSNLEKWDSLSKKLASLKDLATRPHASAPPAAPVIDWSKDDDDDEEEEDEPIVVKKKSAPVKKPVAPVKKATPVAKPVVKTSSRKPLGKPLFKTSKPDPKKKK